VKRPLIRNPDDAVECYAVALRSLERRWHAEKELESKLRQKGFGRQAVADAVERLRGERWIDDGRFAEAFARERARRRLGPERIRVELIGLGVDPQAASVAAQAAFEDGDQEAALAAACRKKSEALARRYGDAYLATDEGRNKLTASLLKQGYDYAAVRAAVRGLNRS
jgi:regulatory protein